MSTTVAPPIPYAGYVGANMISAATPFVDQGGMINPVNWRFLYQVFDAVNKLGARVAVLEARSGVTDGSNAAAGQIGEYLTASGSGGLTSATPTDLATLTLQAGDWDVSGSVALTSSAGNVTFMNAWLGAAANTPTTPGDAAIQAETTVGVLGYVAAAIGPVRWSITAPATSTVYLGCQANFLSGTASANVFIQARRVR